MGEMIKSAPNTPYIHEPGQTLPNSKSDEKRAFAALRDDGFVLIDLDASAGELCDAVVLETEPYLGRSGVTRVQDAWYRSSAIRALASNEKIIRTLERAYGRAPFAFQTLNFQRGSEQTIHTDALHFQSDPPGFMCGVWIALEDIHRESGPLTYYAGSHNLPYPETLLASDPTLGEIEFSRYLEREVSGERYSRMIALPKKGQAAIWAANLAHGGAPILDRDSTRRSLVIHYFFRGTANYTPINSRNSRGRKRLRLPVDIANGRWVWPRRNGRPLLIRPQALLLAAWRSLRRRPKCF